MPEQRSRKLDLAALALLAVNLFLAVAMTSYDPADPPTTLVYPPNESCANACGPLGAWAARTVFSAFGLGAWYALLSLSVLTGWLLSGRNVDEPVSRLAGWLLTLLGVASLCSLAVESTPGPAIGPGGYLGAAALGVLEGHFAATGAAIVSLSLIVGGLLLSTDYVVFKLLGKSLGASARGAARVAAKRRAKQTASKRNEKSTAAKRRKEKPTEEESPVVEPEEADDEEDADDAADVPVKVMRRRKKGAGDEPEAEEESATPSVAKRLAGALRVRNRRTKKADRDAIIAELEAASRKDEPVEYELPPLDLLLDTEPFSFEQQEKEVRHKARLLEKAFANFGFNVRVVEIETGPVIAQYEVELEAGLRLSKITGLADDLAVALRVPSVRVVAPIPGKNTVGIEVPNADRQLVRLREVMEEQSDKAAKMRIPMYLGKDVSGNPMVVDLTGLPHLLIAGRTGTGKSVCLNTLIMSMLMTRRPDEVKLLLVDPKMVELTPYSRLPHLMHPVVTDMKKAEAILDWAVQKMEERYTLLMRAGVRHMEVYNQLGEEELLERFRPETEEEAAAIPRSLPYIVLVADEMADLMMTAPKEVEGHIIRLAQKSRAVGIHLILATQKPTVDVITGLIKSNLPARISFQVASRTDSRVVLDEMGADKLLGNGDLLFLWPGTSLLHRGQGAFVSDDEIRDVVNFLATNEPQFAEELMQLEVKTDAGGSSGTTNSSKDDLYDQAVEVVIGEGRGSVSLLQRALGIGYGRAARLIDYMAEDGIVGAYNGSQARDVLMTLDEWHSLSGGDETAPEKPSRQRNKVVLGPRASVNAEEELEDDEYEDEGEGEGDYKDAPWDESDEDEYAESA